MGETWGNRADIPLPKRTLGGANGSGAHPMLPSTWQGRRITVEYLGPDDEARCTSGKFLDACGFGVIIAAGGAGGKVAICWDAVLLVELDD